MAAVVDHMVQGMDRERYEPIVFFDSSKQSLIREKLSESNIKTIEPTKFSCRKFPAQPHRRKNKEIGRKVETHIGKRARQFYFSLKSFQEFVLRQAPRIRAFVQIIRQNKIDLVHTHNNLRVARPEIIAAWLTNVPCILHNHGYLELTYFDHIFSRFVDSFIYISQDVSEYHMSQGKPLTKGKVIHNGIDISAFKQQDDTTLYRSEFNINSDDILVGLVGRIVWWKGHDYFVKALAEVVKQIPNVKGLIIGEFRENSDTNQNIEYNNRLHSLIKSLNLENRIIFTGFRSDVPSIMHAMDVIVHASTTPEPFGLVIVEGMAAGKPVIAAAAGGVLDIIEDGVNGLLVPIKDSDAMAEAMLYIISNPDKAIQMGLAARRHVVQKFTIQHQVTSVQNLYDSLLVAHEGL